MQARPQRVDEPVVGVVRIERRARCGGVSDLAEQVTKARPFALELGAVEELGCRAPAVPGRQRLPIFVTRRGVRPAKVLEYLECSQVVAHDLARTEASARLG